MTRRSLVAAEGEKTSVQPPPSSAASGGPYLGIAVLCERVLQEADGVLSIIRVVDRVTQQAIGPEAPDEMPPVPVALSAVVMLKAGQARGSFPVRITLEGPSGERLPFDLVLPVLLEGEDRGVNLVLDLRFQAEQQGLYWFDVLFGRQEELLTRVPLRIVYQPQRFGTGPPASPPTSG
jgi:hypothetical protein